VSGASLCLGHLHGCQAVSDFGLQEFVAGAAVGIGFTGEAKRVEIGHGILRGACASILMRVDSGLAILAGFGGGGRSFGSVAGVARSVRKVLTPNLWPASILAPQLCLIT
jgi:hypothetical protein